jgi:hypothetical protein
MISSYGTRPASVLITWAIIRMTGARTAKNWAVQENATCASVIGLPVGAGGSGGV